MPLPGFLQNLTNTAISDPTGNVQFVPKKQAGKVFAQDQARLTQPGTSDVQGDLDTQQASQVAPQQQSPQMQTPSFQQANNPLGGNLSNPALSKGGKLLSVLMGAAQGAGAGAGQRTFGQGFEQGQTNPIQQMLLRGQVPQQQAQTELLKQQATMVQTPYGMLPAALAKAIFPAQIKANAETTAASTKAQGQVQAAEVTRRFIPVQGVGLFDSQSRQVIPGTENAITITPEIAKDHNLPDEFIGKPMKLTDLAAVQRSDVFANTPVMTAQGPIVVNRKTTKATPVTGPGGQTYTPPALASPMQVGDVNNPGQTKIVSGGTAIAQGAPGVSSASVEVPKAAAKSEVPTGIGNQKVAFTTMINHADLLRQAAKANANGDLRPGNALWNSLKTEFGDADYTDLQAIANAYNHEVTTVISKGHITEGEVAKGERTLPLNANYATIDKVLNSYQALAKSKMENLNKQKQSAVNQSQPKNTTTADPLAIR